MKNIPLSVCKAMLFLVLLTGILEPHLAMSQPLVVNGNFETYTSCPSDASQLFLAAPWVNPSTDTVAATPDYFNSCVVASCNMGVPSNRHGSALQAHSGNGYAGIITYYRKPPAIDTSTREYLSIPLSFPLTLGIQYTLSFYARKPSTANYATQLGAHFSAGPLVQNGIYALGITPNAISTAAITDTNWTLITATYTAAGNETHLTLGNFANDAATLLVSNVGLANSCPFTTSEWLGYYLVDDVSVSGGSAVSSNDLVAEPQAVQLYPNPFFDQLTIGLPSNAASETLIRVYNAMGQLVHGEQLSGAGMKTTYELSLQHLTEPGMYFLAVGNSVFKLVKAD